MKLISWNVNGLRAVLGKGFMDFFNKEKPDVLCLQEIKLSEDQLDLPLEGYNCYYNYAEKKGYSGTAVFSREEPLSVFHGNDNEGRITALEFDDYYVVCVYTPNSQDGLARLDYRLQWDEYFRGFVSELDQKKTVLICGDLNVAHKEIDIKNPKANLRNAGFTIEERDSFSTLLDLGFVDTFRMLHPTLKDAYSWWSYRFKARERNAGWRIDYWLVSERSKGRVTEAGIMNDIQGSDHCPVYVIFD